MPRASRAIAAGASAAGVAIRAAAASRSSARERRRRLRRARRDERRHLVARARPGPRPPPPRGPIRPSCRARSGRWRSRGSSSTVGVDRGAGQVSRRGVRRRGFDAVRAARRTGRIRCGRRAANRASSRRQHAEHARESSRSRAMCALAVARASLHRFVDTPHCSLSTLHRERQPRRHPTRPRDARPSASGCSRRSRRRAACSSGSARRGSRCRPRRCRSSGMSASGLR